MPSASDAKLALQALAIRVGRSIVYSVDYLPAELAQSFWSLLSPSSLWAFCVVLACYFLSLVLSGGIAAAISGLLILYGIYSFVKDIEELLTKLSDFSTAVYVAKDETDLRAAGKLFAEALDKGLFAALQLLLSSRAFRLVERIVARRFRAPPVIEESVRKAKEKAEAKKKAEDAQQPKPRQQPEAKTGDAPGGMRRVVRTAAVVGGASAPSTGESVQPYLYVAGVLAVLAIGAAATRHNR